MYGPVLSGGQSDTHARLARLHFEFPERLGSFWFQVIILLHVYRIQLADFRHRYDIIKRKKLINIFFKNCVRIQPW